MSVENRYPQLNELQTFIDWMKNVPEAQLRVWLVDSFCKGEIGEQSGLMKSYLMHKYGIRTSMIGIPPVKQPERTDEIIYARPGEDS